jgi:hypothetical protein
MVPGGTRALNGALALRHNAMSYHRRSISAEVVLAIFDPAACYAVDALLAGDTSSLTSCGRNARGGWKTVSLGRGEMKLSGATA